MAIQSYLIKNGIGIKKNEAQAIELCLESCSKGSKLGEGMKHLFGYKTEKNEKKAFEIFKQGVEEDKEINKKETPYFIFFLARCYDLGTGVEKDIKKTIELYEIAIRYDLPSAIYNLATLYDCEIGVVQIEKDIQKSIKLYEKSASLGNSDAIFALG